jgi:HlyD family secretion protein
VEGDRVKLQPVQIGQRNEIEAQVTSGVADGQTVVMHPPDTLTDGMRVTIRK